MSSAMNMMHFILIIIKIQLEVHNIDGLLVFDNMIIYLMLLNIQNNADKLIL